MKQAGRNRHRNSRQQKWQRQTTIQKAILTLIFLAIILTAVIVILAVQSALGFLSLADIPLPEFANTIIFWSGEALIWISTVFAVISGVIYLKQNWKFIENI